MENMFKKLAEIEKEIGYAEIIISKIEINPLEVRAQIEINESMINYIKSISILENEEILKVFEPVISEVEKAAQILKNKINNNQREFKKENMLKSIKELLNILEEE
ncbi:hypothetical protein [uncultured Thomasclavelia sp.]|uniref:hypothetical protein n=1 Tax=uncultured Thomasclavelia sp. TaxID=3025759 RepID=UPI002603B868|nr:hypothetical protein [uncultured Thomasclavelia sp.]